MTETSAVQPVTINITSAATGIDARHVWTDDAGITHGALNFGPSWIVFHDPAQAREVRAKLATLEEAMITEAARAAESTPAVNGGED